MENLTKVEQLAGQFVAAEIANGNRNYRMHEVIYTKIDKIAKFSVALAKAVIEEANKSC